MRRMRGREEWKTYPIGVVQMQNPTATLIDLLMACLASTHFQACIHVDVVGSQVQADEDLKHNAPSRECLGQEDQEARGGAAVCHHVEDSAERCRLVISACCYAVEGVEETGYRVEKRTGAGVDGHVVKGCEGEEDAGIAYEGMSVREDGDDGWKATVPMRLGTKRKMFSCLRRDSSMASMASVTDILRWPAFAWPFACVLAM